MRSENLDTPALAAEFTAAHPVLDPPERRLVLAIVRLLGEGKPFGVVELAERAGLAPDEAAHALDRLPMVQRDDQGQVFAYGGLTLEPTPYVLEVDGRTLLRFDLRHEIQNRHDVPVVRFPYDVLAG